MTTTKPTLTDSKLTFIKVSRVLVYMVYGFVVVAITFLTFGFFLLLFGASPQSGFVTFVYNIAEEFLSPFRGIFPLHQLSTNSYFSASALFAIIFYLFAGMAIHALIDYVNLKKSQHEAQLAELERQANRPSPSVPSTHPHDTTPPDHKSQDHPQPPHSPERV